VTGPSAPLTAPRLAFGLLLAALAVVMGLEILFQYRAAVKLAFAKDTTHLARLELAYTPFSLKHFHPHYFFFFPLQADARLALGNDVCSLDRDGFREPGPGHAAGKPLAFLLGGSAAFGDYASSNATTITSFLNAAQDDYFFVNAGVPSWNSTQELYRVAMQIIDLKPALVIAYDGANDAVLAAEQVTGDATVPAGSFEGFEQVRAIVDDGAGPSLPERLFPELMHRFWKYTAVEQPEAPASAAAIEAGARRYVLNHHRMAELSRAAGARFISVFQPVASLHARTPIAADDRDSRIVEFHRHLQAAQWPGEFVDLAAFFDTELETVPIADSDLADNDIFVDEVHLSDRGNAMVARRLLQALASRATP